MTDVLNDLDALRAAFDQPAEVTIGVEEEFFVVDRASGDVTWVAPALCSHLADARFKTELPAAQLEHMTVPHRTLDGLAAALRTARSALVAGADGLGFASAGTHPTAPLIDSVPDQPHYREMLAEHPWSARQQMVAALQVHVAVGPAPVAVAVHDALRSYLPDLLALSAASPFSNGRDTGLAAVRPLIATMLPRQGVPPAWGSWERYAQTRTWWEHAGVTEERRIWWEARLRPAFGTIEVRVADGQPTSAQAAALATLIAGLACRLAQRARDGEPLAVHPTERIAENRWRAVRDGRSALLADLDSGDLEPLERRIQRLCEDVAPVVEGLGGSGLLAGVSDLLRSNGADQQRAAAEGHGAQGAARWLAEVFAS